MAGRPTKYKPEFSGQAEKLCKLGFTDEELASFFEVDVATINRWKTDHSEFCESIKKGKDLADANVAEKLYKRATGYTHPDVDIRVIDGEIVTTSLIKYYPPDTPAAIFWLKNRQKKKWRDKIEHGLTDEEGKDRDIITVFQLPDNGRNPGNTTTGRLPDESAKQPG